MTAPTMKRFSKAKLRAYCEQQMRKAEDEFLAQTGRRIDPNNGTSQTHTVNNDAARVFGEWNAHRWILDRMDWGDL